MQKQYGVVPYVKQIKKNKIVLITSLTSHQWIVPKGDRINGKSKRYSANKEAYEEAGLIGQINEKVALRVVVTRRRKKVILTLYPMEVKKILKSWPEKNQRKRTIVSFSKAYSLMNCPQLRRCIRQWQKT